MECLNCKNYFEKDDVKCCRVGATMKKDEKCRSFESKVDMSKIDHPAHYNEDGAMECIEEMVLLYGYEETKSFCKLNAHKYRYRSPNKNGDEDRAKANYYIAKYKELCVRQNAEKKNKRFDFSPIDILYNK